MKLFYLADRLLYDYITPYRVLYFFKRINFFSNALNKNHEVFITGFPRSGNTFLTRLTRCLFPGVRLTSHLHTVAALKNAKRLNIKFIVVKRKKLDCIPSLVLKNKRKIISRETYMKLLSDRYDRFYDYAESHAALVVDFEELTKNPGLVVKEISSHLGRELPQEITPFIDIVQRSLFIDSRDPLISTYPNIEKQRAKKELVSLMERL